VLVTLLQALAGLVALVGGAAGLTAFAKVGPERRKITAEAYRAGVDSAQVLATTSVSLLDPYLDQIKFLRSELAGARMEITSLRTQLTTVEAQVARLTTGLAT
jgi:hypothetical protein